MAAWSTNGVAQDVHSSMNRVFWSGTSAGEPSEAKRATLIGIYALSVAGAGVTGYWAYSWLDSRQHERNVETEGACYDLVNTSCRTLLAAQEETRSYERLTAAGAAATAALVVSGALVAQYWDNSSLRVNIGAGAIAARFEAEF